MENNPATLIVIRNGQHVTRKYLIIDEIDKAVTLLANEFPSLRGVIELLSNNGNIVANLSLLSHLAIIGRSIKTRNNSHTIMK